MTPGNLTARTSVKELLPAFLQIISYHAVASWFSDHTGIPSVSPQCLHKPLQPTSRGDFWAFHHICWLWRMSSCYFLSLSSYAYSIQCSPGTANSARTTCLEAQEQTENLSYLPVMKISNNPSCSIACILAWWNQWILGLFSHVSHHLIIVPPKHHLRQKDRQDIRICSTSAGFKHTKRCALHLRLSSQTILRQFWAAFSKLNSKVEALNVYMIFKHSKNCSC